MKEEAMTEPMDADTLLRAADALRTLGFDVEPAPLVVLGARQRTATAMSGPFGGLIEAALQAQAVAGTLGLQALTAMASAADAAALLAAAEPPQAFGGQAER
jgi:hypothetical protein